VFAAAVEVKIKCRDNLTMTFMRYILGWLVCGAILLGQSLSVGGAVKEPLQLKVEDLAAMPRASVETENDGLRVKYEGVWLHEILKKAGAPVGQQLRGKALASYVVATAEDGYQVVFSLGELDAMITGGEMLVADRADGKALAGAQGPLRLVVAKDKRGARSVRMLTKIEVVGLRK